MPMCYSQYALFCLLPSLPCSGAQYKIEIGGQECTVEKLLEELYQKAAIANLWSLVRHTAGMLRKSIENLGAVSLAGREGLFCFYFCCGIVLLFVGCH